MYCDFTQKKRKARFSLLFVPPLGGRMEIYMTIQEMRDKKKEMGYTYAQIADLSGVPL